MSGTRTLSSGTIKRLHVNQQVIRRNVKHGEDAPTLTIQTSLGPLRARRVSIRGPSTLIQSIDKPLSCGARVWVETHAELEYEE
jgi:hypothetical protein